MVKLSVTILTLNEQRRIEACLESVKEIADEIIVVDSLSTDATLDICRRYGCRISQRRFQGYGAMRQYATSLAKNSYVLAIDADEVVSRPLAQAIMKLKEEGMERHRVYCFNRLTYYCDRPVRSCGLYPDLQIRLFDKRYANWNLRDISESVIFRDSVNPTLIEGELLHYPCLTPEQYHDTQQRHALIRSRVIAARGAVGPLTPLLRAAGAFINAFFFQGGITDGAVGRAISREKSLAAFTAFSAARKLLKDRAKSESNNSVHNDSGDI